MGEAWGHLFVAGQVGRWLSGDASFARADLLNFPGGQPFWPTDPVIQLLQATIRLSLGATVWADAAAMTMVIGILFFLAGLATWHLARILGAGNIPALGAGLLVQLHPYILQNANDSVVEVLAIGPAALLLAEMVNYWRHSCALSATRLFLASLVLAGSSPYFAVYTMLGMFIALPFLLYHYPLSRRYFLFLVVIVGYGAMATPIVLTESGEHGRLGATWQGGGYQPTPHRYVKLATTISEPQKLIMGGPSQERSNAQPHHRNTFPPTAQTELYRFLVRFPGGIACALSLLAGLAPRRSRPWALLGSLFLVGGPGPTLAARALHLGEGPGFVPLQEVLSVFPLTTTMGNHQRMVMAYALLAAISGALVFRNGNKTAMLLPLAAVLNALTFNPQFRVASSSIHVDQRLMDFISGPVITFPNGEAPLWNQGSPSKLSLYLATRHGQPVSGDFGRGHRPSDLLLTTWLSLESGLPVSDRLLSELNQKLPSPRAIKEQMLVLGYRYLLVLDEYLTESQQHVIHETTSKLCGPPLASSAWASVYDLQGLDLKKK